MSIKTREQVLDLVEIFTPDDLRWLREQLDRLLDEQPQSGANNTLPSENNIWDDDDDEPLPESATLDEAVQLYLDDKCSLGRAAELAGVTRWHIQDILKERGIGIPVYSRRSAEEIDELAERLEQKGIL